MLKCDKCEEWIDLHKCYETNAVSSRSWPFVYEGEKSRKVEGYWGMRAFWFLWKHKDHGQRVSWDNDCGDTYWEIREKYKEVASHDDMVNKYKQKRSDLPAL